MPVPDPLLAFSAYGLVLALCLARRFAAGAAPRELVRRRFAEIPAIRMLLQFYAVPFARSQQLWTLATGVGLLVVGWKSYERHGWIGAVGSAVLAAAFLAITRAVPLRLVRWLDDTANEPLPVRVRRERCDVREGVSEAELLDLGRERFPDPEQPNRGGALAWRMLVASAAFTTAYAVAKPWIHGQSTTFLGIRPASVLRGASNLMGALPGSSTFWIGVAYASAVVCVSLALTNLAYLTLPFGRYLAALASAAALAGAATLRCATPGKAAAVAIGLCLVVGIRMLSDLWRAWRSARTRRRARRVTDVMEEARPILRDMLRDPELRLSEPDARELDERMRRGASKLAEADLLVTPHFERFFLATDIRYRGMACAALRTLSVRRYTVHTGGRPTRAAPRSPAVPVWDLRRFPLASPPSGFADRDDSIALSAEWNVVQMCGGCNGSGWQLRQEPVVRQQQVYGPGGMQTQTVTEYETVQRPCGVCGGAGRMEYQQSLVTSWRRHWIGTTEPFVRNFDLIAWAEEEVACRLHVAEAFERITAAPECLMPDGRTRSEAEAFAARVAADIDRLHESSGVAPDARLYRADVVLASFHAVRVTLGRMNRTGWFFGRRPEFFFPRLPFGWSRLGALITVPPVLWILAVATARAVAFAVDRLV